MSLTLTAETEKVVTDALTVLRFPTADELVRAAVQAMVAVPSGLPTDAELEDLLNEADRTGGRQLADVREELRLRFGLERL